MGGAAKLICAIWGGGLLLGAMAAPCQATVIKVDFEYTITSTFAGFPAPVAVVGESTFEFPQAGGGNSYSVLLLNVSFNGTPLTGFFNQQILVSDQVPFNPPRDRFQLYAELNDVFLGVPITGVGFALEGPETITNNNDLFVPDPSEFFSRIGYVVFRGNGGTTSNSVQATLTSLTFSIVPEPDSMALVVLGLIGLSAARRLGRETS